MKNVKIYIRNFDNTWNLEKEFDEVVTSIIATEGNYVVVLEREDYFGKVVFLYDMSKYKIEILPNES